jgi:hypothetical protein
MACMVRLNRVFRREERHEFRVLGESLQTVRAKE